MKKNSTNTKRIEANITRRGSKTSTILASMYKGFMANGYPCVYEFYLKVHTHSARGIRDRPCNSNS